MIAVSIRLIALLAFLIPVERMLSYVLRKLEADMQARVGPSLAFKYGVLQTTADFFKHMLKKEPNTLRKQEKLWFLAQQAILFSCFLVVPLGPGFPAFDTQLSLFLPIIALFFYGIAACMCGVESGDLDKSTAAMRRVAQATIALLPTLFIVLAVGIHFKGFSWQTILQVKPNAHWGWNILSNPIQFVLFFLFLMTGTSWLSFSPMNSEQSVIDVAGGTRSAYVGTRRVLFDFSEFCLKLIWSSLAVSIFLGDYRLPKMLHETIESMGLPFFVGLSEWVYSLTKIILLMIVVELIAKVSPRYRVDQATDFIWKILSPATLFCVIGEVLWTAGMDH